MSRVGKNPIEVPDSVTLTINGKNVTAKGKLGELSYVFTNDVEAKLDGNKVVVKPVSSNKRSQAMWGTARSQINNLVIGVDKGFSKNLKIVGVGYKAAVQGKILNLALGYSNDVNYPIPDDLTVKCSNPTSIEIFGVSKQRVGQIAAEIRSFRSPEPYKGKGIRYEDEIVLRKEGKKK